MAKVLDQAGVIPIREGRVGLITSSNGKRWVIPKGHIDPGHTALEAAKIEAWEEAGWVGVIESEPLGEFTYRKEGRDRVVTVFVMTVHEEHETWPEQHLREREWMSCEEALSRIDESELRRLVRMVNVQEDFIPLTQAGEPELGLL
jgi:8-oxo-dGTP pyrophosphatase MutT (NUDIX family)